MIIKSNGKVFLVDEMIASVKEVLHSEKFLRSGFGQTLLHKQSWPPSKFRIPVRESDESSLTADDFVPQVRDV